MKRAIVLAALCVAILQGHSARAQPSGRAVAAEELFTEGRSLLAQNRFKEACEKFDASSKLDPAVGTLLSLGHCYEGQGRTASAWFAYRAGVALAAQRNDLRRSIAEERASALESQLSTFVVHFSEEASQSSTQVEIDGEAFGPDALRAPIAVDPGAHSIEAKAVGRKSWTARVEVQGPGGRVTVEIPVLESLPDTSHGSPLPMRRVLSLVSAGVGVAGIAVGAISGELAISRVAASKQSCPFDGTMDRCNATGVGDMNQAKTFALASDISFGVGALGLVGGLVLWLMKPQERPTAASPVAFSDPASWFWGLTATPHGSEGFVGHAF